MHKKLSREEKVVLLEKVSEQIKTGETKGIIAISCLQREYSTFNQCFLAAQEAIPGVFGGFQQWLSMGRQVKKGEHGYSICFPMKREGKNDEDNKVEDENPHFAMTTVFHIDQTEEKEKKEKDNDPQLTNAIRAGAIID